METWELFWDVTDEWKKNHQKKEDFIQDLLKKHEEKEKLKRKEKRKEKLRAKVVWNHVTKDRKCMINGKPV